jgi:protocatechuate 3,4-dioxygenase beta subunit
MMKTRVSGWLVALLLLAAPAAAQQSWPPAPGTSSISGHVVASDTGKPIRNAVVEIVIYENLSGRFQQVATDSQGRFEFTKIPAGHYQLAASGARYVRMQFGAPLPGPVGMLNPPRIIEVKDGESFATADFTLLRFCAIEGVITDEFGDPAPNVVIQISQVQYGGGRKRLIPTGPGQAVGPIKPTDDKGQFRIGGLPPGEYYVEALSGAFADPNAAGGFAVTFYPGTTKPAGAQAVSLEAGKDATNVSFMLTPAAMAPVSGTLVDSDGRPVFRGTVTLMPSERTGTSLFMMARTGSAEDGHFDFRNVSPGVYTIQAFGAQQSTAGNLGAAAFGYLTFTLDGRTNEPLTVRVPAPRTMRGHITFEGDPSTYPKPADAYVSPRQVDFESAPVGGGPSPMTVKDDWTFEVKAMSGLRVVLASARPNWLVKRVTLAGQDVTDTPLDLREHDVNDVEILMTTKATTVTGTVTGPDDKPAPDYHIVIFANDDTKWAMWSRYVSYTRSGPKGTFGVRGLPAGSYFAVAVPAMITGEWQDPEYLQKLRLNADAVRFTLLDEESKAVILKLKR